MAKTLTDEAREAYRQGSEVFSTLIKPGYTLHSELVHQGIMAVESQGWRLEHYSFALDGGKGLHACIFRRV